MDNVQNEQLPMNLSDESGTARNEQPAEAAEAELAKENRELSVRVSELTAKLGELEAKQGELSAELLREQVKVLLLIAGILPEKLEDGAAMAYGLCLAGKAPETAASEIIEAYPHLKAMRREMPTFSAESRGSGDGFSAIRRIFSMR